MLTHVYLPPAIQTRELLHSLESLHLSHRALEYFQVRHCFLCKINISVSNAPSPHRQGIHRFSGPPLNIRSCRSTDHARALATRFYQVLEEEDAQSQTLGRRMDVVEAKLQPLRLALSRNLCRAILAEGRPGITPTALPAVL